MHKQIVVYLDETQINLLNEIADVLNKSRNEILRDAVNCYISMYLKSFRTKLEKEMEKSKKDEGE